MPGQIQSAYAMVSKTRDVKHVWTPAGLRTWLVAHNHVPMKHVEHIGNEIRYRILPKSRFVSFETEVLPNGIHLVIGFTKKLSAKKKKSAKKR